MENTVPAGYVVPNPRIPKVLGILNIVFASAMLLCGLCSGAYYMMLPGLLKATTAMQKTMEKTIDDQKKADLKKLDEDAKAATTDEEKVEIETKREAVRSRPRPNFGGASDMTVLGLDNPKLQTYMWTDVLTGLVLNLMLLFSGIFLVTRKPSGITLGLWTAGLKIVRLVLLYSLYAIVIVPVIAQGMGKMALQQMNAGMMGNRPLPPQINLAYFVRTYSVMLTVMAIGMIIVGSIYPAVSLWLLTRPGARAACSGEKSPSEGPEAW